MSIFNPSSIYYSEPIGKGNKNKNLNKEAANARLKYGIAGFASLGTGAYLAVNGWKMDDAFLSAQTLTDPKASFIQGILNNIKRDPQTFLSKYASECAGLVLLAAGTSWLYQTIIRPEGEQEEKKKSPSLVERLILKAH
jgi:hypothetical protein